MALSEQQTEEVERIAELQVRRYFDHYLSEVFPNLVRAKGQSLGSFTHWIMNAIISGVFPAVAAISGPAPFAFFSVMMVVQFFVVLLVFPETKGVALEDMEKSLGMKAAAESR